MSETNTATDEPEEISITPITPDGEAAGVGVDGDAGDGARDEDEDDGIENGPDDDFAGGPEDDEDDDDGESEDDDDGESEDDDDEDGEDDDDSDEDSDDDDSDEDGSDDEEDAGSGLEEPEPMSQMIFVDVSMVLPSTHPTVVLQEAEMPYRELRIPVGGAEGVAIGYAARQVPTPRPLTHEMISKLLDAFDLNLDAVHITAVHGANFVAELVVSGRSGVKTIDCRPSDAIALALRRSLSVPIMATPEVLELAGGGAAGAN